VPKTKSVVLFAIFAVLWLASDLLADHIQRATAPSPWYLGGALDLALLWALGARWMPPIIAVQVLRSVLFHRDRPGAEEFYILGSCIVALGFAIAGETLRRLGVSPAMKSARDVAVFAMVGLIAPLPIGALWSALGCELGRIPWAEYGSAVGGFWTGDAVCIVAFGPMIAAGFDWIRSGRNPITPLVSGREVTLWAILLVSCVLTAAWLDSIVHREVIILAVAPLAWMALRGGLGAAYIGTALLDICVLGFDFFSNNPDSLSPSTIALVQFRIIVASLTTLTIGGLATARNIQTLARNAAEVELRRLAFIDTSTNLPNRLALERWSAEHGPLREAYALSVEIDHMEQITDGLGRQSSDLVMQAVSIRLAEAIPDSAYFVHTGWDSFAAIVNGTDARPTLAALAARLETPIAIGQEEIYATLSVGVAYAATPRTADELVRDAGLARRRARSSGGARSLVYDETMIGDTEFLPLVTRLRRAYDRSEFVMYAQPIYRFTSDLVTPVGTELLLRWRDPDRGSLTPDSFLNVLESTSFADRVASWVLDEAVRTARAFAGEGHDLSVWMNVGPRTLNATFVRNLDVRVAEHGIDPRKLVVEVNEKIVAADREVAPALHALRERGVAVAIDDFGTGHSSLGRIRELPIDIIKLDRSLIAGLDASERARGVVEAVFRLARELGVEALAEGIETAGELDYVVRSGCPLGQGYVLSRPMPLDQLDLRPRSLDGTPV
jgi:diguanylate cyclase (GGDEF)-like protein